MNNLINIKDRLLFLENLKNQMIQLIEQKITEEEFRQLFKQKLKHDTPLLDNYSELISNTKNKTLIHEVVNSILNLKANKKVPNILNHLAKKNLIDSERNILPELILQEEGETKLLYELLERDFISLIETDDVIKGRKLYNAIYDRNFKLANELIEDGAALDLLYYSIETPAHLLVKISDKLCNNIIELESNFDDYSKNPRRVLLECGNLIEKLKNSGANFEIPNIMGETVFEMLTNMCNKYETTLNKIEKHNLHSAINKNNFKLANKLIDNGADLNFQDSSGDTPAHLVVKISDEICDKIVKLASENDYSENLSNSLEELTNLTEKLKNSGADFKIPNNEDETVFDLFAEVCNKYEIITDKALEKNTKTNIENKEIGSDFNTDLDTDSSISSLINDEYTSDIVSITTATPSTEERSGTQWYTPSPLSSTSVLSTQDTFTDNIVNTKEVMILERFETPLLQKNQESSEDTSNVNSKLKDGILYTETKSDKSEEMTNISWLDKVKEAASEVKSIVGLITEDHF